MQQKTRQSSPNEPGSSASVAKFESKWSKSSRIIFHQFHNIFINFPQLKHDLAFLTRNEGRISFYEAFLRQWRALLASEPSKGFGTLFKKPEKESAKTEESTKTPPPPSPSKSSPSDARDKPPPDWNFGMFGPNPAAGSKGGSQGQGQGRPIGGEQPPDQTKMFLFGALGFAAFVTALTYFEMGYKEISWKEFVNK